MYTCTFTLSQTDLQYDLSICVDVSLISKYHAECHGIIGSLGDVLHQLDGLLQAASLHSCLLSGPLQVSQQKLILRNSLYWLDQERVNTLPPAMLILNFLLYVHVHACIEYTLKYCTWSKVSPQKRFPQNEHRSRENSQTLVCFHNMGHKLQNWKPALYLVM